MNGTTAYILILGNDVIEQFRADLGVVPLLCKVDSIHLPCFKLAGDVARVNLMISVSKLHEDEVDQ